MGNYNTRDGFMTVNGGGNKFATNYEPNSAPDTPVQNPVHAWKQEMLVGKAGRYPHMHPNDNYEQPRALFRKVFDALDRHQERLRWSRSVPPRYPGAHDQALLQDRP